ncbi:AAA family ATPase [Thermopolyspora sp. NPDC052614]|uniref:helix-turn-helix transcriptional regulator n=1 Tax=Thermopolyspora sp. NPDC052614 TaxID=3155682 RepID=UPI00343F106F
MLGRAVSPVFVGREEELANLLDTFDRARRREASAVLVGGEAGVGKTRLVARFAELAAERGARVLVGGCVELSTEGLAYAPFTAALRQLVRETGTGEITALLPDGAARDLARLLPEFGEPTGGDRETDTGRARLFEQFLTLLERLAEKRPVLLVIEDVHWADRSSRDLIAFLSRNLLTPQVVMLLTYRSDELHRQHPLRPVLARLARIEGVLRMELPRLTRDEVAAQMAGILGTVPEYARVSDVYQRSEGIPLFVEAMVDCDDEDECTVPSSLHDLIIAAFERLPEETQRVLRVAAAGGTRVGHALLAAVSGLSDVDLEDALRPAIAANVILIADGDAYAFRHSLIREAVHEELLPGEHIRLHARFAEEIERDRGLVPPGRAAFEIAHHWYSARDDVWALIAAWEAAGEAAKTFAYTEQIQLLERVLTLWDKVPDAAERLGTDHAGVLDLASEAALACGELERGIKFVNAALGLLDEGAQAERVAMLLVRRSQLSVQKGRPLLADLRRAADLVPLPSAARAHVLEQLSRQIMLGTDVVEGAALVQEALRIARELGDECLQCDLLLDLSIGQCLGGDPEEALATNRTALEIAQRVGSGRQMLRALCNSVDVLNNLGRTEEALKLADEAETLAREYGRHRVQGIFAVGNRAETLEATARWDEAETRIEHALALDPTALHRHHLLRVRCDIALARGDADLAERILREVGALGPPAAFTQDAETNVRLLMGWHLLRGDAAGAAAAAHAFLALRPPSSKAMLGWRLLTQVEEVCWTMAAVDPAGAAALRGRADAVVEEMRTGGPVGEAYRLAYRGEFDAAAVAWDRLGRPYMRAKALTRAAHAVARAGDRDGAAARLREALPLVAPLGARPLIADIEALARRVGATLLGDGEADGGAANRRRDGGELTPREREVLRLVALGRSNRDIADELFISTKTVSVHVSKILAKLGVSSRGEAAATAHRQALLN